jgi:excisionase family DNA binding protein
MNDYEQYLTPEQVAGRLQMGTETVYRYLRSGKLRGRRISHKAWRISEMNLASFMRGQNVSELFFEQYLAEQGLARADHEPEFPGATKRVDYRLLHNGKRLWFEVKEFADDMSLLNNGGAFDPYAAIRGKIHKVREKFRDYDGECCSLVLFNEAVSLAHISTPGIVLGAMLGSPSFRVPVDLKNGRVAEPATSFFGRGGKITVSHDGVVLNTTISAVIALERLPVGQREIQIRMTREELKAPHPLTWEETFQMVAPTCPAEELIVLRTIVYESPYATSPLPKEIFRGAYDQRWSRVGDQMAPIYVGSALEDLERRERELDLHLSPMQRFLKTQEQQKAENKSV